MRYPLVSLILFILLGTSVYGQQCRMVLKGRVVDYHDQTPLAGAVLELLERGVYTTTDFDGTFQFEGLCPDVYELQVSHIECRPVTQVIDLQQDTEIKITLEHHIEALEEVTVLGEANPNEVRSGAEVVLDEETLSQYSSGSLGDALKEISGVSSINTGASIVKPVIQGLYGSRVLILKNEVRLQDMEWGEEHAPNVDLNSSDNVRVIKGSGALRYGGDAVGGVIVLENDRTLRRDSLWGNTMLSGLTNGRGGSISSELTRSWQSGLYARAQASFRRLGDTEAPDYVLSNTGNQQIGVTLEVGNSQFESGWSLFYSYYDATLGILRASHIGNIDDLIRSINNGTPEVVDPFTYTIAEPRQEVAHHLGKATYYKRFSGLGKWELQYDFQQNQRFEFDVNRTQSDAGRPSIDLTLTTHSLSTNLSIDRFQGFDLEVGLLGRYQDNFADPATGVRRLIPDYNRYEVGGYATAEWLVDEAWTADAGVRYDYSRTDAKKFYRTSRWEERGYDEDFADIIIEDLGTQLLTNPVLDFSNVSASAGVTWHPNSTWTAGLQVSRAERAPNPSELFSDGLHHSAARIELGDLRIEKETSYKGSLNLVYDRGGFRAEVTPYVQRLSGFILLEPTGTEFTIRGAFPVWSYRQTDASLAGVDVNLGNTWGAGFSSTHQFSLVKGRDLDLDTPLINVPAARTRNELVWEKQAWHDFQFGLESLYVFRQNEFPENIVVFSPEQGQDVELAINTPPPAYHLLNLHAGIGWPKLEKASVRITLHAQNVLNVSYRDYLDRLRYFADSPGRNLILNILFKY
ncbi:TonB-dependent receptor [Robiginitalea sediminis]|uniref:TonB-dependent receptor n=1 Tax=Robiginitalea sediminis TaxID=1982593 RepID=UPI000B4B4F42|nr:TonB-dependent receptor [Robiginitalea sediminis]